MDLKKKVGFILSGLTITLLVVFYYSGIKVDNRQVNKTNIEIKDSVYEPIIEYGINVDSFNVHKGLIQINQVLGKILSRHHVSASKIDQLAKASKKVFDVRRIASGKSYMVLCSKDSIEKAEYFIYAPNAIDYVVFDMRDSISIYKGKKEVVTKIKTASGIIKSSLYQTLDDADVSPVLAIEMADVFAWTIDFYRIQKNDWFKVVYEERFVDGESIGIGKVLASNFNHYSKDFFACYFVQDSIGDYFDIEANSLRRAFLKSPLKFGRLTSGFTMRRFHPVQKRNKPHLGTDYAAPTGTPIMTTGDGIVIAASYTGGNGNYVKVQHNSTYTTQYLHMSKRGVKVGQHVIQGDVIGYVGSTGLATGPHVCYRFWKNGSQTNHLKEDFPPSKPVEPAHLERYKKELKKYENQINKINLETIVS
jgi:murein DD-endopeptidase MepM/ murein hydrolase activator NlpD